MFYCLSVFDELSIFNGNKYYKLALSSLSGKMGDNLHLFNDLYIYIYHVNDIVSAYMNKMGRLGY